MSSNEEFNLTNFKTNASLLFGDFKIKRVQKKFKIASPKKTRKLVVTFISKADPETTKFHFKIEAHFVWIGAQAFVYQK